MKIRPKQYAQALLDSVLANPGKEKEIVKRFSLLLSEKGQLSRLAAIIECFESIWNDRFAVSDVEISSARPLSDEVYKLLIDKAAAMAGAERAEVVKRIDPSLLGGAILRYRDKILDISLYTKFEHLKDIIKG